MIFERLDTKKHQRSRRKIGTLGMIIDAKDKAAAWFYEKFGFRPLSTSKNRLVLPFSAIKALF